MTTSFLAVLASAAGVDADSAGVSRRLHPGRPAKEMIRTAARYFIVRLLRRLRVSRRSASSPPWPSPTPGQHPNVLVPRPAAGADRHRPPHEPLPRSALYSRRVPAAAGTRFAIRHDEAETLAVRRCIQCAPRFRLRQLIPGGGEPQ